MLGQPDHVVPALSIALHVDGLVDLLDLEQQHLGLLVLLVLLELLCVFAVERGDLVLRQVAGGELLGVVVLLVRDLHLEGLLGALSLDEEFFCLLELLRFGLVLGDLLQLGSRDFTRLVG